MSNAILDRLDAGTLIRDRWTEIDSQGRATACLLAALAPETGVAKTAGACPAEIIPQWFAQMIPWINDSGSSAAWQTMVRRFGGLAGRWHVLTSDDWRRLQYSARRIAVEEAATHVVGYPRVAEACCTVIDLCRAAENGDFPTLEGWVEGWVAMLDAVLDAVLATVRMAPETVRTAPETVRTAPEAARAAAAAEAVLATVRATVRMAPETVQAAREAARAAATVLETEAASWAAADRMTAHILDALDTAIARRESYAIEIE